MSVGPWLQVVFLGMVLIAVVAIILGVLALRSLSDEDKSKGKEVGKR